MHNASNFPSIAKWLSALVVTVGLLQVSSVHAMSIQAGIDDYNWLSGLQYWVDPSNESTLLSARQATFSPAEEEINFGFKDDTFWFRGELENVDHPQSNWIWWIQYALLDYVDLYLISDNGAVEHLATGDHLPFDSRHLSHRQLNFGIELPMGQTKTFYLRVRSSSSIQVPARIVTPEVFAEHSYHSQLGFGVLYGSFIALILYNLILYFSMRDITFLHYVLYVSSFMLFQAVLNGFAFQYLWPNNPAWANRSVIFFMPVIFFAMSQFCRSFLELKRYSPLFDKAFIGLMMLFAVLAVASFAVHYRTLIRIETGLVFLLMATLISAVAATLRRGYRPALYFAVAWSVLIIGILLYASVSFGVLPKVFLTEYGFQIGSAAEMILLSFALAYRINLLREENARIVLDANQMLEERVEERTRDLNNALLELSEANQQLEQASLRDGLTGVHNRRHLDQALRQAWREAVEQEQWLALVVLDLDHFKSVNDELGHLAGDDCLKAVAVTVSGILRYREATFARFGGEEFFIVLPRQSIEDARLIAERLRQAIAELEVQSGDHQFKVTASFGVAALRPEQSENHSELIQRADDAMYEAKQAGRNCVVTAAPQVVGAN